MPNIPQMLKTLEKEKEIIQAKLNGINEAIAALNKVTGSRQGNVSEDTRRKMRLAWKKRKERMKTGGAKKGLTGAAYRFSAEPSRHPLINHQFKVDLAIRQDDQVHRGNLQPELMMIRGD